MLLHKTAGNSTQHLKENKKPEWKFSKIRTNGSVRKLYFFITMFRKKIFQTTHELM